MIKSTIVEIFLYYLTVALILARQASTIVEIFLYYLTNSAYRSKYYLQ